MNKHLLKYIISVFISLLLSFVGKAQSLSELLALAKNTESSEEKLSIYKQIAYTYQKQQAYSKASEYLNKAYALESNPNQSIALQENIGRNEIALQSYDKAMQAFEKAYQIAQQESNTASQRSALVTMVAIAKKQKNYTQAIAINQKVLALDRSNRNPTQTAQTLNNMGVLYQVQGKTKEAKQHFQKALLLNRQLYNQSKDSQKVQQKVQLLYNMATMQNYLRKHEKAMEYIHLIEQLENQGATPVQIAEAKNLKAITYYLQNNNNRARGQVTRAIRIGKSIGNKQLLASSYQILAEIEASEDNSKAAQEYFKKYLKLKDEVVVEENQKQEALLDKQIETEKQESQILQLISKNKQRTLELEQTRLENEKKQQALELQQQQLEALAKDKELQAVQFKNQVLEKKRVAQALQLAKVELREEKRQKEIENLEKQKKLQSLELEKQALKDAQYKKEKKFLKEQKRLKERELAQQKTGQFLKNLLLIIGAVAILVILFFLYLNARKSQKLSKQKQALEKSEQNLKEAYEESQIMNEELRQAQEEVQTQRDYVEERNKELSTINTRLENSKEVLLKMTNRVQAQNEKLTESNRKIHNSIRSAKTMQDALLPPEDKLSYLFREYFIIYRPLDVVSGDFYWASKAKGKTYMVAADCTGHGVPGAFMATMGALILYSILKQKKIYDPAEILEMLHQNIGQALKQKETGNLNGMDLGLFTLEEVSDNNAKVCFCGAKRSMYYIEAGTKELKELRKTRKAIGGIQNRKRDFQNREVTLPKGSLLYLGSDGLEDQNNVERRKFSNQRLLDLLKDIHHLPLKEQQSEIERQLDAHMEGTRQRDDILWIGVKI